jgi:hypothetical protein
MPLVAALFRKASYSPHQHRANDTAILERTLAHFERDGWAVTRVDEDALEPRPPGRAGARAIDQLPPAALYLNMCQGTAASEALLALEARGAMLVNRPSSVLGCHRHRLAPRLAERGVRFPPTEIVDLSRAGVADVVRQSPIVRAAAEGAPVWIKRGDVHAERDEDVVCVPPGVVLDALVGFASRAIGRVALQAHVPGAVLKFYGVADGSFFRYYDAAAGPDGPLPNVDEARLRALVFDAAAAVGLDVFGGDVALRAPDDPVLIDLNDWPSFAPFRDDAAAAIAAYARSVVERRRALPSSLDASLASDVA